MHRLAGAWLRRATARASSSSSSSSSPSASAAVAPAGGGAPVPAVGGPVAEHALLGLSPEYRELLLRRAARAHSVPVLYSNPGAYAQLDRLPEGVLAALPPPPRPLYPMTEREHSQRLARGFAVGLFFVALALYLHLKRTSRSGPRLELERRAPLLSRALVAAGALQDLGCGEGLDRAALFRRVFARYRGRGAAMPTGRALLLLRVLLDESGATAAAAAAASAADGVGDPAIERAALDALAEAGLARKAQLSCDEFVALLASAAGLRAQSDTLVALACAECLGVAVAAPEALEVLGALFDRLAESRAAGRAFSAAALTEVCHDAGFVADEADAAAFLADCAFAAQQARTPPPPPVSAKAAKAVAATAAAAAAAPPPSPTPLAVAASSVPLQREQFADFLAGAALAAGVPGARIVEYVRVYEHLHLSGLREAAGVAPSSA